MSKEMDQLKRRKYNAAEALNIIISEEYSLGTSSSDNSGSESSYSDETSDTNSQLPSPKCFKSNIIEEITCKKKLLSKHGKINCTDLSETHVQPTSVRGTPPSTLPDATKKSDTTSTVNLTLSHDNSDDEHSPDTTTLQITASSQLEEEFVLSIPIHLDANFENKETVPVENEQSIEINPNTQEIHFPCENINNFQQYFTNSDNDSDYIIKTENNKDPQPIQPIQYPITNHSRDIDLQQDINNGWIRVENDQVPDHCQFIGNLELNMNTAS